MEGWESGGILCLSWSDPAQAWSPFSSSLRPRLTFLYFDFPAATVVSPQLLLNLFVSVTTCIQLLGCLNVHFFFFLV